MLTRLKEVLAEQEDAFAGNPAGTISGGATGGATGTSVDGGSSAEQTARLQACSVPHFLSRSEVVFPFPAVCTLDGFINFLFQKTLYTGAGLEQVTTIPSFL